MNDLTNFNTSINHALAEAKVIEKLDSCKTKEEIIALIEDACKNITGPKTVQKKNELISNIKKSPNATLAKFKVTNFFLKGTGNGVI